MTTAPDPAQLRPNKYHQAKADLEARKCKTCSGLGTCDDAHSCDIYYNEWTCRECNGSGFAPGATTDLAHIWLEPECCADPSTGRMWAPDNPWLTGDCEATGVEYVRAELVAEIEAAAEQRGYERGRAEAVEVTADLLNYTAPIETGETNHAK